MNIRATRITTGLIAASLATVFVSGAAQAALQGRDLNGSVSSAEAYYDTVLDITWLADANYAKTSGHDADGLMTWTAANTWAANLSFTNGSNVYDNWRLPTVTPINGSSFNYNLSYNGSTDYGYNVSEQGTAFAGATGSEMAHLFYNTLNNKGYMTPSSAYPSYTVQTGRGLTNTVPFTNLQANNYWSGSVFTGGSEYAGGAWYFGFTSGSQDMYYKFFSFYALAVSAGDVGIAVAAVPEADTWAMLLAGLGLVGVATRRRRG